MHQFLIRILLLVAHILQPDAGENSFDERLDRFCECLALCIEISFQLHLSQFDCPQCSHTCQPCQKNTHVVPDGLLSTETGAGSPTEPGPRTEAAPCALQEAQRSCAPPVGATSETFSPPDLWPRMLVRSALCPAPSPLNIHFQYRASVTTKSVRTCISTQL